jgi:hypothetical protein
VTDRPSLTLENTSSREPRSHHSPYYTTVLLRNPGFPRWRFSPNILPLPKFTRRTHHICRFPHQPGERPRLLAGLGRRFRRFGFVRYLARPIADAPSVFIVPSARVGFHRHSVGPLFGLCLKRYPSYIRATIGLQSVVEWKKGNGIRHYAVGYQQMMWRRLT